MFSTQAFLTALRITLTIVALLGFGFYLWHLKSNGDQSQSRLLNILNGYLSLTCMGFSLTLLYASHQEGRILIFTRISAVHIIAVSTIFLLVSWATILNHFKPSLYLDISVSWSHRIAIPLSIFAFHTHRTGHEFHLP